MENKKVSMAVIKRLPRYYRYLYDLLKMDIRRVSSKELSERMGITASQIRQDLNCFGGFGQQGYGYNVESLYNEIGKILGIDEKFNTVIVGAGHLGTALANHESFNKRGFKLRGIFDVSEDIIGKEVNGIKVMHIDTLKEFAVNNKVDIAILTIPNKRTLAVAKLVSEAGIKGIWNFSPTDLNLGEDLVVENVHLSDGLMVLGYRLRDGIKEG